MKIDCPQWSQSDQPTMGACAVKMHGSIRVSAATCEICLKESRWKEPKKWLPKEPIEMGPPAPVPRESWPLWACAVAKLANSSDVGVGSTIKRLLALAKIDIAAKAVFAALGVPCGCDSRAAAYDIQYSYR